jgi:multidrug resistance efflux pump
LSNSLNDLENNITLVKEKREEQITSAKAAIEETLFQLHTKIQDWELGNLMVSPISGRLDRSQFWSKNQLISNGDVIAMVIPEDPIEIICRAIANVQSISKLKKGQRVLMKLDGFNAQQFGSVEGTINSISTIPYGEDYQVKINLTNKLVTMDNVEIPLIQGLTGIAEVVIDESRLIKKLLNFKN